MKPMVRLWRVEHRELGCGPFNNADRDIGKVWPYCWVVGCDYLPRKMPPFWEDTVLRDPTRGRAEQDPWRTYGPYTRFAWPSLASVQRWVDERAAAVADQCDFVVRLVAVPWGYHVRLAEQAVYDIRRAMVLRTMSVMDAVRLPRVRVQTLGRAA